MSVGQNIKMLRESVGLTQRGLARKLNISQAAVSQFENSKNPPKLDTLLKIAEALNVDVNILLDSSDSPVLKAMKESNSPFYDEYKNFLLSHSVELNEIDVQIINNFHQLNSTGQRRLLEYLSEILKIKDYLKGVDD